MNKAKINIPPSLSFRYLDIQKKKMNKAKINIPLSLSFRYLDILSQVRRARREVAFCRVGRFIDDSIECVLSQENVFFHKKMCPQTLECVFYLPQTMIIGADR